jgi:hypothetical protein
MPQVVPHGLQIGPINVRAGAIFSTSNAWPYTTFLAPAKAMASCVRCLALGRRTLASSLGGHPGKRL